MYKKAAETRPNIDKKRELDPPGRFIEDHLPQNSGLTKIGKREPSSLSTNDLLSLQRSIGNKALLGVIERKNQNTQIELRADDILLFENDDSRNISKEIPLAKRDYQTNISRIQLKQRKRRPQKTRSKLLDRLLAPNSPLWRQLNPDKNSRVNCPATVAAVDEYLSTGNIRPAPAGKSTSFFKFEAKTWSHQIRHFRQVRNVVSQPNTFVVVHGKRSQKFSSQHNLTPDHYFVIVNRRGRIIGIDAFGEGKVINDLDSYIRFEGFSTFRFYNGSFRVKHIPLEDQIFEEGL